MNKALFLILVVSLITQYHFELSEGECEEKDANSVSECEKLNPGDYHKCCLYEWNYEKADEDGFKSYKFCSTITKEDYDNIKDYVKKAEKEEEDALGFGADFSIDCGSNYIMISLMSLILLLL